MDENTKTNIMYSGLILITLIVSLTVILKFSQPVVVDLQNYKPLYALEGDVKDFVIVAQRFAANHDYNETGYNCNNYSKDLKAIADQLGFKTQIIRGCTDNEEPCHIWLRLEVDFEPQTALFMDYSLTHPNQEVIG